MDISSLGDNQIVFWQSHLSPLANQVYQFSFLLSGETNLAKKNTLSTFEMMLEEISSLQKCSDLSPEVAKYTWLAYGESNPTDSKKSLIDHTDSKERCALGLIDYWGVDVHKTAQLIGWSEAETYGHLSSARKKLLDSSL